MTGPVVIPTCYQIMVDAYMDAGLIQEGDTLDGNKIASGMRHLNKYINFLGTEGLSLNFCDPQPLNLVAGKAQYNLGPGGDLAPSSGKPMRVIQADYVDVSGQQRPLIPMGWQEYYNLSSSTILGTTVNQGMISQYLVNKQPTQLQFIVWMTPDAATAQGSINVYMQFQASNFTQVTDKMMFPPEWALTLEWGLAAYLATGQPQAIVDRCERFELFFRDKLINWDVEDASTTFQPDTRLTTTQKKFGY